MARVAASSLATLALGAALLAAAPRRAVAAYRGFKSSRRSGITCRDPRGHGFTVSVERQRVF